MNNSWNKAYIDEQGRICYQSGATMYCEQLAGGRLRACGYNTGATGRPEGLVCNPDAHLKNRCFALTVNGTELVFDYEWANGTAKDSFTVTNEPDGSIHALISLAAPKLGIGVDVHTVMYGVDVMVRYLTLRNLTDAPMTIGQLSILGGGLFSGGAPATLGHFVYPLPGGEGDYHTMTLPIGRYTYHRESYNERYAQPFCIAHLPGADSTFICQMAYSGGFALTFDTNCIGGYHTEFEASVAGAAPLLVLRAGEVFTTPKVFFGMVKGTADDAIYALHRAIHAHYAEFTKTGVVEASVGPGECEQEDIIDLMDTAKRLGGELFFIDAGWYIKKGHDTLNWPGPCGDWTRTPDRYDYTLDDFRERAHSLGMKFGLWMDLEKLGWESKTYQEHLAPRLVSYTGADMQDGPCSAMLNVVDPAGLEWAYKQITYVLDTYKLDYYRLDSGTFPPDAWVECEGYRENASLRYYTTWYALFERLRREYPNVIFQNCAGGGMRCDVGMTGLMSNTWISDVNAAPHSFRIANGMSMMLPVEYLVKLFNGMGAEPCGTLDFVLGVTRFGSPLIPTTVYDRDHDVNPLMEKKVAAYLESYKKYVRPMLHDAHVYHHTPEVNVGAPGERGVLEIAAPAGKCALLGVFTLGMVDPKNSRTTVHFAGLDVACRYDLYCNDVYIGQRDGWELTQGFVCDIPTAYDARCYIAVKVEE